MPYKSVLYGKYGKTGENDHWSQCYSQEWDMPQLKLHVGHAVHTGVAFMAKVHAAWHDNYAADVAVCSWNHPVGLFLYEHSLCGCCQLLRLQMET